MGPAELFLEGEEMAMRCVEGGEKSRRAYEERGLVSQNTSDDPAEPKL